MALATVFFSCNKQETIDPDLTSKQSLKTNLTIKEVEIQEGVLKFASKEHLKNVTQELGTIIIMVNWFPNFTSLLNKQESISAADYDKIGETGDFGKLADILVFRGNGDDKILEKIVEDPRLAAVLNSKGYVIVGDSAYQIGVSEVASIKLNDNKSTLVNFLNSTKMDGVNYNQIINESFKNARVQDYQRTDGNRRIIAEFKKHNAGVYYSLVVKLRYLKKNWVGWSGTEAESLSFSSSGTYWRGMDSGLAFSGSASGSNVAEVTYFVDEAFLFMGWENAIGNASWQPAVNGVSSVTFYPE